jgi:hypothetical protein
MSKNADVAHRGPHRQIFGLKTGQNRQKQAKNLKFVPKNPQNSPPKVPMAEKSQEIARSGHDPSELGPGCLRPEVNGSVNSPETPWKKLNDKSRTKKCPTTL